MACKVKKLNYIRSISFFKFNKKIKSSPKDPVSHCLEKEKPARLKIQDSCFVQSTNCCMPKVLIVGGGMAGLSAACQLQQCGINDFLILEGKDQLGGRIQAQWLGDTLAEFGPSYIEGASVANPIFNLANTGWLLKAPLERIEPSKSVFLTGDGRALSDYRLESLVFDHIISQAKELADSPGPQPPVNLLQFFSLRIQQALLSFPKHSRYDSERILFGMVNSLKAKIGAPLNKISAVQFGKIKNIPGGNVVIPGGFKNIFSPLQSSLPENKIILNKPVDAVILDKDGYPGKRVTIKTCDGTDYHADYVILTVPLGVLKFVQEKMFRENPLPCKIVQAIDKIGFGTSNKVFLEYASPWWTQGEGMQLAWSVDDLARRRDWTKSIGSIEEIPQSKVICVTVGGEEAEMLESCSEEEIAVEFTRVLRKIAGDSSLPYPCSILMTRWKCNPFSRGSTVYMGVDTRSGHFVDINGFEDIDGVPPPILFAGDGTIVEYFGTVHGARMTGLREANKIIAAAQEECKRANMKKQDCQSLAKEALSA